MSTRTIKAIAGQYVVIYRGSVEKRFPSLTEAEAYIRAGKFPSVFTRRGPSPFRRH